MLATNLERRSALMSGPSRDTVDSQVESNPDANEENRILRRRNVVGRRSKWLYPMLLALLALFIGVIGTPVVVLVLNSESRLSIHRANGSTTATTGGLTLAAVTRHSTTRPHRTAATGPSVNIIDLTIPSRARGTRGSSTTSVRRTHRPDTKRERLYGPEVRGEKTVEPSVQLLTDHPVPFPEKKKSVSNLKQHDHYKKHRHKYGAQGTVNAMSSPTPARFQTTRKNVSVAEHAFQVGLSNHSHKHFARRKAKDSNKPSTPAHSLKGRHRWSGHKKKKVTAVSTVVQSSETASTNETVGAAGVTTVTQESLETTNATTAGTGQEATVNQTEVTADTSGGPSLNASVTRNVSSDTSEATEEKTISEEEATSMANQSVVQTSAASTPKPDEGGLSTAIEEENDTAAVEDVSSTFSDDSEVEHGNETSGSTQREPTNASNSTVSLPHVRGLLNATGPVNDVDTSSAAMNSVKGDTRSATMRAGSTEAEDVPESGSSQEASSEKQKTTTWTLSSSASTLQDQLTSIPGELDNGTTMSKTLSPSKPAEDSRTNLVTNGTSGTNAKEPTVAMNSLQGSLLTDTFSHVRGGLNGHTEIKNYTESSLIVKFSHVREGSSYTRSSLNVSNATRVSTKTSESAREVSKASTQSLQSVARLNDSALSQTNNPSTANGPAETGGWNVTTSGGRATSNTASAGVSEVKTSVGPAKNSSGTMGPLLGRASDTGRSVSTAEPIRESPSGVTAGGTNRFNATNAATLLDQGVQKKSSTATKGVNDGDANETGTTSKRTGHGDRTGSNLQPRQHSEHEGPPSNKVNGVASTTVNVSRGARSSNPPEPDVSGSTVYTGTFLEDGSRATTGGQKLFSHSPPFTTTLTTFYRIGSSSSETSSKVSTAGTSTARPSTVSIGTSQSTRGNVKSTVRTTDRVESSRERHRKFLEPSTTRLVPRPGGLTASTNIRRTGTTTLLTPATNDDNGDDDDDDEESDSTVSNKSSSKILTTAHVTKTLNGVSAVSVKQGSGGKVFRVLPEIKLELRMPTNKTPLRATTRSLRHSTGRSTSGIGSRDPLRRVPQRETPWGSSLPSPRPATRTSTEMTTEELVRKSTVSTSRLFNTTIRKFLERTSTTTRRTSEVTPLGPSRRHTASSPAADVSSRGRTAQVGSGTGRPAPARNTKIPASVTAGTRDVGLVRAPSKESSPRSPESPVKSVGQSADYYDDNTTFINGSPRDGTDEPETVHKRRAHEELDDVTDVEQGTSTPSILQTAYYDDDASSETKKAAKPTADDESPQYENSPEDSFDDLFYR